VRWTTDTFEQLNENYPYPIVPTIYLYSFIALFITAILNIFIFIIEDSYHAAKYVRQPAPCACVRVCVCACVRVCVCVAYVADIYTCECSPVEPMPRVPPLTRADTMGATAATMAATDTAVVTDTVVATNAVKNVRKIRACPRVRVRVRVCR